MGYCINQRDCNFTIKADNVSKALDAIREFIADDANTRFAWVDMLSLRSARTFETAMKAWRWHAEWTLNGDVRGLFFRGEKLGNDIFLFQVIAPYVQPGSYIEMSGEDGALWRWYFDGIKVIEEEGTITWSRKFQE